MRSLALLAVVLWTAPSIAPAQDAMFARCAGRVKDVVTGDCVRLSTDPLLGTIYPLSNDWFIDPLGNTGLGTTAPVARLDVAGDVAVNGETIIDGTTRQWKGGVDNTSSGTNSFVGGGYDNDASGYQATIGGGNLNTASGSRATVGGGGGTFEGNTASGNYSVIVGGASNLASGIFSTIAGGGNFSSILGGNIAPGNWSAVGGGDGNVTVGELSTIAGGRFNTAFGDYAAVGGGWNNAASGQLSSVGGGGGIGGLFIGGNNALGARSTIAGGAGNTASGASSTVPGGLSNGAVGNYSFAAGRRAKANHAGAFVWGDSFDGNKVSSAADEFNVYASGGVRMFTNNAATTGVVLAPGGGSWSSVSDRAAKENVEPVDGRAVLARVVELPIATWNYKEQAAGVRHMGPMAQDFRAAFGLGVSDQLIDTVDPDGVALAAIQGLNQLLEDKDAEIAELRAAQRERNGELAELRARQAAVEAQLAELMRRR